jgi:hypothetical protein
MTLSSQKPQRRTSVDYQARRARHYGLRAVALALGLRDFVELRSPHRRKRKSARAALGREGVIATMAAPAR